jgi:hypothetical protein
MCERVRETAPQTPKHGPHIAPPEPDIRTEMGMNKTPFKVDDVHDLFLARARTLLQGRKPHIFFLALFGAE